MAVYGWQNHQTKWKLSIAMFEYLVVHPTNRKWVITLVINGISGVSPLITGVLTHLLTGMNHQVQKYTNLIPRSYEKHTLKETIVFCREIPHSIGTIWGVFLL